MGKIKTLAIIVLATLQYEITDNFNLSKTCVYRTAYGATHFEVIDYWEMCPQVIDIDA